MSDPPPGLTRRDLVKSGAAGLTAAALATPNTRAVPHPAAASEPGRSDTANRPNLLLITSDQQHWFTLGVQNPHIHTPNLDRLAAMGCNFTRAYCPNPTCTPTRSSILTGQYPSTHGAYALGTRLDPEAQTLGDLLRDAGYRSTLIGKAHFQPTATTDRYPSVESWETFRKLDFWRGFNDTHTPWYGFDRVETARMHGNEGHAGAHYALWMEEQGFKEWRQFFKKPKHGIDATPEDAKRAQANANRPWDLPPEMHYTAWTGQRTIAAIEEAHRTNTTFFIWSSYHDPHPPYACPEPWFSMYDRADMPIGRLVEGELDDMPPPHRMTRDPQAKFGVFSPDGVVNHGYHPHTAVKEPGLRRCMAVYYGMISFMDEWIGKTLDKLDELGIIENTLIVFTSDHGHFIGHHGLYAKGPFHYEDMIRVPMIAAWKGQIAPQQTSSSIQSLVDLAPTFAATAGLEPPRRMQGLNALPEWTGAGPATRDHALVENRHSATDAVHLRTVVTDRHKLTVYRGRPWGELFDLTQDPGELENLFDDPSAVPTRCALLERLVQADLEREHAPMPRLSTA